MFSATKQWHSFGASLYRQIRCELSAGQTLETPTIYILGGPKDIAYPNGMDDFTRIAHVPVAVANLPVGHGGTFLEPNGGAAASVAVSWLDWQLRGDTTSARRFVGESCGLCRDSQ